MAVECAAAAIGEGLPGLGVGIGIGLGLYAMFRGPKTVHVHADKGDLQ